MFRECLVTSFCDDFRPVQLKQKCGGLAKRNGKLFFVENIPKPRVAADADKTVAKPAKKSAKM